LMGRIHLVSPGESLMHTLLFAALTLLSGHFGPRVDRQLPLQVSPILTSTAAITTAFCFLMFLAGLV